MKLISQLSQGLKLKFKFSVGPFKAVPLIARIFFSIQLLMIGSVDPSNQVPYMFIFDY